MAVLGAEKPAAQHGEMGRQAFSLDVIVKSGGGNDCSVDGKATAGYAQRLEVKRL